MYIPDSNYGGVFFEQIQCQLYSTMVVSNTSNHLTSHAFNKLLSLVKDLFMEKCDVERVSGVVGIT